jgi:hypothetical protein
MKNINCKTVWTMYSQFFMKGIYEHRIRFEGHVLKY